MRTPVVLTSLATEWSPCGSHLPCTAKSPFRSLLAQAVDLNGLSLAEVRGEVTCRSGACVPPSWSRPYATAEQDESSDDPGSLLPLVFVGRMGPVLPM